MGCYWNNKQSSDYADKRDNTRYIIFPDDIQAENGELGFCEGIFQAIETALDILDALDLAFLAVNIAKKIKEFIRLLRLLLQEYRNDPNKYRKVLKDLIIQLKELIQELEIEKVKGVINDVLIDQIIAVLENLIKLLEQVTGIGCTVLNFAFLHPIDNQKYDTLCRLIDGRDGIERWLVNNITSIFGLIKFKPTDPTYDRIILSRKRILTRIFDEVCTCIDFGNPPPFVPTVTPSVTNTCTPCRATRIPVYDLECIDTLDGEITPIVYQLNQNGVEIPVSIIDMVNCTENPNILNLLTCTLTICTPTTSNYFFTSSTTGNNTSTPINTDCIIPGTFHCYERAYQGLIDYYTQGKHSNNRGHPKPAPPGTPYTSYYAGSEGLDTDTEELARIGDWKEFASKIGATVEVSKDYYDELYEYYLNNPSYPQQGEYQDTQNNQRIDVVAKYINSQCHYYWWEHGRYAFRISTTIETTGLAWVNFGYAEHVSRVITTINITVIGCLPLPSSSIGNSTNSNSPSTVSSSGNSSITSSIKHPTWSPSPTPSFTPTPSPSLTLTPTPTLTPTLDIGCSYEYTWDEGTRILCISNTTPKILTILIVENTTGNYFELQPGENVCNNYPNLIYVYFYTENNRLCWATGL